MSTPNPSESDLQLLWHLMPGRPIDAGLLRYDLGIEVEDTQHWINRLNRMGCDISQVQKHRYQLNHVGLELWQDYLDFAMAKEGVSPIQIRVYRETTSTQDQAKQFAPNRTLVLSDQQNAGRGRLGREWLSTPGASVLMSLCCPIEETSQVTHDRISMLVGLATAKTVESLLPNKAIRLKWPNDVVAEGRKLSGILIEATQDAFIIGIGINVTHESLGDPTLTDIATCLRDHGCKADRLRVIERIMIELDKALRLSDSRLMLDEWRVHAALGQTQTFENNGQQVTGEVIDLDPDHGLIVRRDTGEIVTLPAATTSVVK